MLKRILEKHKTIFFVLIFLLPLNLGKHFEFNWSYTNGSLIDYQVPTIYVQDILIIALLVMWVLSGVKGVFKITFPMFMFLSVFVLANFLSLFVAQNVFAALYGFIKLLMYLGLFFYTISEFDYEKDFPRVIKILGLVAFYISTIAIFQWFRQGSIFNNYLILGEQPYSFSTKNIAVEMVFGQLKVASYSIFRHPNIFAGFLTVILFWLLDFVAKKPDMKLLAIILVGSFSLLFTFSYFSFFVYCTMLVFLGLSRLKIKTFHSTAHENKVEIRPRFNVYLISLIFFIICFIGSITFPFFAQSQNTSVTRREDFLIASAKMIKSNLLDGVGLNNNVSQMEFYLPFSLIFRYNQPVHNIFILIFSEAGFFAFAGFLGFSLLLLYEFYKNNYLLGFLSLLQLLLLGLTDHYMFTIHQTFILFWLTLGISLTYNFKR